MITTELENARKQLLDLTARNRLLSIPQHARARILRIEDERSDEVLRILVQQGRKFSFLPQSEAPESEPAVVREPLDSNVQDFPTAPPAPRHTDSRLQTDLRANDLHKCLYSFFLDARTAIEEQGVNTLFLALGQLQWRDDRDSGGDRFAPLLLVPVELQRTNAREAFRLVALEQEPSNNLSLVARLQETGVRLPDFEWSDDFVASDYFAGIAQRVEGIPGWKVHPDRIVLGFFSFAKFLMYRDLDPANWPGEKGLAEHALIRGLLGPGFAQPETVIPDDADLDQRLPVEQLSHVVDADSSQAIAIEEVRAGNNLIIQGPPGTGKSQSITNLIATAVLDGKKVLFVADKLAALDVVHRRLVQIGLGSVALELHSHKASKRSVLEELKRTLGEGRPEVRDHNRTFQQLQEARERLNRHARLMNSARDPSGISPIRILGEIALREGTVATERLPVLRSPETWGRNDFLDRQALARDLQARGAALGPPVEHPWRGVGIDSISRFDQEAIAVKIQRTHEAIDALLPSVRKLAALLQAPEPESPAGIPALVNAARWIGNAPTLDRSALAHPDWASAVPRLRNLITAGRRAAATRDEYEGRFIENAWTCDLASLRQKIAAHGYSILKIFNGGYRAAVSQFRSLLKDPRAARDTPTRLKWLDGLIEARKQVEAFAQDSAIGSSCFGNLWQGLDSDWTQLESGLLWVEEIGEDAPQDNLRKVVASLSDPAAVVAAGAETARLADASTDAITELFTQLKLDPRQAFGVGNRDAIPFAILTDRLAVWSQSAEPLTHWVPFHVRCEEARQQGMDALVQALLSGDLSAQEVPAAFELAYFRQIYAALLREEPTLARFDGHAHNQLVEDFRTLDLARIEAARLEVVGTHDQGLPRSGGLGAIGILKAEMNKRRNHMPIRRLLAATGPAVQAIKPVFMMSPLSVAQFLEPGKLEFDLVVFDEASQVQPVDALGAIARGRQLVVVGDDRQLPPTRFFSRFAEESEWNDDDAEFSSVSAGDLESILGLAAAKGIPGKMLRWHYRSRHPSLIAVSNYQFYDSRLYTIPTPRAGNPHLGLSFRHIPDGVFDRGRTMRNSVEARAVAEAVLDHARNCPEHSLGVAAFSVSQRDAILAALEQLQQENPDTDEFFRAHPHEPFFVKNLENVQGDERDCIFISVGYSRDAAGSFSMNFGPLNRDGGERRLNVLISRSKLRCVVFSSIVAGEIDLSRTDAVGVSALKTFLHYAQTRQLGNGVPGPDGTNGTEPLVESIRKALEVEGFATETLVGNCGFYIDLAVVDPANPGHYLLGIECDGPGYNSARSARERDRQRSAVLAFHGWKLHRIWATDWLNRPGAELQRVLAAIQAARSEPTPTHEPPAPSRPRREAPSEIDLKGPNVSTIPYQTAKIRALPRTELADLTPIQLAPVVLAVIEAESPIHHAEVTTRLREAWGLQRTGSRIAAAVDSALAFLEKQQRITREGDFWFHPGKPVVARSREAFAGETLREPERIAPAEVQAAIVEVVAESHRIQREELVVGIARKLGFASTSAKLAEWIDSEITLCSDTDRIRIENGQVTPR